MSVRRFAKPWAALLLRSACIALFAAPLFGQAPVIVTASLPQATAGKFYQVGLTVSGGIPPLAWTWTGNLPAGLTVHPTGSIVGTPSFPGTFSFSLTVTDRTGAQASRLFSLVVAAASLSITNANPLPSARITQPYALTLIASGGASPYRWSVTAGFPPGLTLNSQTGVISGTPTTAGAFSFTLQVQDAAQAVESVTYTLNVDTLPLEITTVAPLFAGTAGVAYAQPFTASGGKPPYTWTVSGDTGGLTLDGTTGILRGVPQARGTFAFTIRATDTASASAAKDFSITVMPPTLSIAVGATLPAGMAEAPYSQKLQTVATGGVPPYRWSVSGLPPGLSFDGDTLTVSGTPTASGDFTFVLLLNDAAAQTANKTLTITIRPAQLSILSARQFPDGTLNAPYSTSLSAIGGAPPYTWSAVGLPDGVRIDSATGSISGVPTAAGNFAVAIAVGDTQLNRVSDRFTLTVTLPSSPPILLSGLPGDVDPAAQYRIQVQLGSTFPAPITGQAILTFAPDSGPTDRTVQFASGGTIAAFSIPTGATVDTSAVPLAIQTGTVSGTISISLRLQAGGIDITPLPVPSISTHIGRGAPVITDLRLSRSEGRINLIVSGYSTAREITQATVAFAAANGQTLQAGASSLTIAVESLFSAWFQDAANSPYGSQFVFTQPFTVQGDSGAVIPQSVTLTNRIGSTTYRIP